MSASAATAARAEPSDEEILGHFESLGDNCEFGLMQRAAGIERLGFFRFNAATMASLLRALDTDFAGIGDPDRVAIEPDARQELMVRIRDYDFLYHTFIQAGDADVARLRAQQVKVIRFLARKFLEDLGFAEKIFVRKGPDSATGEQITALLRALRRHGPVTLLWVVQENEAHSAGSVEVIEPGVLKGYIDRFGTFENGFDFSATWFDICRNAFRLWRDASPVGTVRRRGTRTVDANLIRQAEKFGGMAWWRAGLSRTEKSNEVPPLFDGCAVMKHTLLEATVAANAGVYGYGLANGVASGSIYVASIWVWLPADFKGTLVGAVFAGFPSKHVSNARLEKRGAWQRMWVSARVPPDSTSANPTLFVIGPAGTRLYSTCWKLEIGVQPSAFEPSPAQAAPTPATSAPPAVRPAIARPAAPMALPGAEATAAAGPGGHILKRQWLPPLKLAPPEVLNPELIPGADRAMLQSIWFRHEFAAGELEIRVVGGATIAGEGLAFTDALELVPGSFAGHLPEEIESARAAIVEARRSRSVPDHAGTHVLCTKNGSKVYGHWLMEMYPKAAVAQEHLGDAGLRFVVPKVDGGLGAVIASCMQSLGAGPERLLRADAAPVRVERLIVVSGLAWHGGYMSRLAIEAVRKLAEGVPPAPHRRLYVTRASVQKRNFADPAAVEAMARARGYEVFDPGTADLKTQIAAFAGAREIVGVMGSGMTNIVFAPSDAEVVVLAPARMRDTFFWFIAALRGQRYTEIRCRPAGDDKGGLSWFYQPLTFPEAQREIVFKPLATGAEAGSPGSAVTHAATVPGGVFRVAPLKEFCEAGVAERLPYLSESVVDMPPLEFGETDFSHPGIVETPPKGAGGGTIWHEPVDAYVLRDAVVHGQFGLVTCGDMLLEESTAHVWVDVIPGAKWVDETRLRLPEQVLGGTLPAAYHLLQCNLGNYFHWLVELLPRFNVAEVRGLGVLGDDGRNFIPLLPPFDAAWKRQAFALLMPPEQRAMAVPDAMSVQVDRLLFIDQLAGGGWHPHRAMLAVFDRMRAAAYGALRTEPPLPWRRLFISRADSPNRMLVNEAEIAGRAAAAGFERIVLDGIGVAEQAQMFAEATHIIAPHGAGLANLVFCRPGAAVCELQMDCYVNWVFRGLAALRGLRYGCLIGPHIPPRKDWAHHNTWRVDPAQVDAVLADTRFIGG